MDLSINARKALLNAYDKQGLGKDEAIKSKTKSGEEIRAYCQSEHIPFKETAGGKELRIARQYIKDINKHLIQAGSAPLRTDFSVLDRGQVAQIDSDEKKAGISPTAHQLLVACLNSKIANQLNGAFGFHPKYLQFNIEVNVNYVNLYQFDCLVIVENRDSFNQWNEYRTQCIENPLVVYRGDKSYAKACKQLCLKWKQLEASKPIVYFGDFDLVGLRIALTRKADKLLLPSLEYLLQNSKAKHYPFKQEKYLPKLKQDWPIKQHKLLSLMIERKSGLRQQNMFDTSLQLYSLE